MCNIIWHSCPHHIPSGSVFGHVWGRVSSNLMQNFTVLFRSPLARPLISFWPLLLCFILLDLLQTLPSEFLVQGVEYD